MTHHRVCCCADTETFGCPFCEDCPETVACAVSGLEVVQEQGITVTFNCTPIIPATAGILTLPNYSLDQTDPYPFVANVGTQCPYSKQQFQPPLFCEGLDFLGDNKANLGGVFIGCGPLIPEYGGTPFPDLTYIPFVALVLDGTVISRARGTLIYTRSGSQADPCSILGTYQYNAEFSGFYDIQFPILTTVTDGGSVTVS